MRELVVVGGGMVGHRLVQALRERDTAGCWRVTVLAEEARPAYDRVALSSYVDGASAEELTLPAVDDPLVIRRLGDPAVTLDRERRRVRTASGAEHGYDALVLATGSVPFVRRCRGGTCPAASSTARSTISTRSRRRPRGRWGPARPAAGRRWWSVAGCWGWRRRGRCVRWGCHRRSSRSRRG